MRGPSKGGRRLAVAVIALLAPGCLDGGSGGDPPGAAESAPGDRQDTGGDHQVIAEPTLQIEADQGCGWVVDADGERTGVRWPDGVEVGRQGRDPALRLQQSGDLAYRDADGAVVADGEQVEFVTVMPLAAEQLPQACRTRDRAWQVEQIGTSPDR